MSEDDTDEHLETKSMNREERQIRDQLMMLAESTKPFNVKRKSIAKQMSKTAANSKLSMQDFVRMDPSYTPDIEHLVFPSRKRNQQQVAPAANTSAASRTRSRLAEMFALSRHLQQRSADRESSKPATRKSQNPGVTVNRSVDSVLEQQRADSGIGSSSAGSSCSRSRVTATTTATGGRWAVEEPVHATTVSSTRRSPIADPDMTTARGPNVSVLHLRSTSEPWETSPTSVFAPPATSSSRSYSSGRSLSNAASLPKQDSFAYPSNYKYGATASAGHTKPTSSGQEHRDRELSPMRWCDRQVDGVFLGRSGWVQVQHRSLDESRRQKYVSDMSASRRTGLKLAEYQHTTKMIQSPAPLIQQAVKVQPEMQRPVYLPLKGDYDPRPRSPPPLPLPDSPPLLTPIISPPPAFQDRLRCKSKSQVTAATARALFGKAPFLPRSNAIIDSDVSPPTSPPPMSWKSFKSSSLPATGISTSSSQKVAKTTAKTPSPSPIRDQQKYPRIPQTKSLEDTSAHKRNKFSNQRESSSSSSQSQSQSLPFRSLDGYLPRGIMMPRLSENTDSSVDVYEDADDEDNNSSSINMSIPVSKPVAVNKISPRGRLPYRASAPRRSPAGSDTKANSPGSSSSSSSNEYSRSPSSTAMRRCTPTRANTAQVINHYQEDPKVRRSRSLQLPEKKNAVPGQSQRVSPQHPDAGYRLVKVVPKERSTHEADLLNEELLREADIVTGFIYGSRSRAAAQALLMARYDKKEPNAPKQRGATTPTMSKNWNYSRENSRELPRDSRQGRDYRDTRTEGRETKETKDPSVVQGGMRSSQSYPMHQRSLDVSVGEPYKKRLPRPDSKRKSSPNELEPRRISPSITRNPSLDRLSRSSPKCKSSSSSSSDYAIILPEKGRVPRSAKSSGASTPMEEPPHNAMGNNTCHANLLMPRGEVILTRPGSAPGTHQASAVMPKTNFLDASQRSMSLPKSFLSHRQGSHFAWRRRGTESLGSSPGFRRRATPVETSQTAPVTPLHDFNRRRSPSGDASRRTKANSTPQLIDGKEHENRKYRPISSGKEIRRPISGNAESVLQKFRKTFSLRFQKKSSKDGTTDIGDSFLEVCDPSEEVISPQLASNVPNGQTELRDSEFPARTEQKHSRFGPLIWRSSKERKKLNKAARSVKCNSGDSGIQIEMAPGCGGIGGDNSSESHGETDPQGDDIDSPPAVRRRGGSPNTAPRPHSDVINQILIDRFKAELRSRAPKQHKRVRRTHSDLGGQRIYHWDSRASFSRRRMSSSSPLRSSPRKKPPGGPPPVQMRNHPLYRRGNLRRSLSQPIDIDKLSPILPAKLKISHITSEDENDLRMGTSDEDAMSDSESSLASLTDRKKSLDLPMDEEMIILAEAVFDHVAIEAEELAFRAGDVVEVLDTNNRDWWWGSAAGKSGWFPANSVRLRVSQEDTVEDCLASIANGKTAASQIRRRTSISLLSNDQVRTSVVRELVHTERDFVKVLQDVAEGYMAECRKRSDMFTGEQIDTIFINLEQILKFQTSFLKDLEQCVDWDAPHRSCVGKCFLKHKDGFKMYSDYCNSHPLATATLQELYQFNNYSKFFEACRLMRGLIQIPLDGYLLTPVQRICKYPLQLAELLKYSKQDHEDYTDIKEALDAMRGVAVLINERKRRMESLEKIEAWQQRVEGWEGEDLIEHSTQLIYVGEVVRVTSGMWTSTITLFLFDHQLVYCKKDILKRNTHVYKGRICLDTSDVIDMSDGKDAQLGVNLRHAIKINSSVRDKWFLVCCRSQMDKQRWLQAFSEERKLVTQDKCDGMDFPDTSRHLAKVVARCQRRPPRKLRNKENYKRDILHGSSLQLNVSNTNSLGRKVGTWFTFGGNKKHRHRDVS